MMKHIYSMLALLGIAGTAGAQTPVETQLKAADIVPGKTIVLKSVSARSNHYFQTISSDGHYTKLYTPGSCNFTVETATYNEDSSGKYFYLKAGSNYLSKTARATSDVNDAAIFYAQQIEETTTASNRIINGIVLGDCITGTELNYLVRFVRADNSNFINCGESQMTYAAGVGGYSAFYVYESADIDGIIGAHACYLTSDEATNTAMLPVTVEEGMHTSATAPFYLIQNNNASDYYCGNITNATNLANAEGYVFVSVPGKPHAYKIYSLASQNFLTWTQKNAGKEKVLTDGTGENNLWWIRPNDGWNASTTAVDILPYGEFTQSWNWHGGAQNNSDTRMGLYQYSDGNSQWKFTNVRATLENIATYPTGKGLGEYHYEGAEGTEDLNDILSELHNNWNDNTALLPAARTLLPKASEIVADNFHLNQPAGHSFIRIKGSVTGNYLLNGTANNGKYSTGTDETASIFYYDGTHLVNYSTGLYVGVSRDSWEWPAAGQPGRDIEFGAGTNTIGKYYVKTYNAETEEDHIYLNDAGDSADRGQDNDGDARYNSWELSYVTSLPLSIGGTGFATLWSPVALTVPAEDEAEVYTAGLSEDNSTLTLTRAEAGSILPAGTGVVVKGTPSTTVQFETTTSDAPAIGHLKGNDHATAFSAADYSGLFYTLQGLAADEKTEATDVVGFKQFTGQTAPAFRSYLLVPESAPVQALRLVFGETTGIGTATSGQNTEAAIYDLSGRRVQFASKGIYIVNGKKTIIK